MASAEPGMAEERTGSDLAREASLEMLRLVDALCKKHGLRYTLYGDSVLGAVRYSGFCSNQYAITIAMFREEYLKFVDLFAREYGESSEHYLLTRDNCLQFDYFLARVMKRSRVTLPEARQDDRVYYDYYLNVLPIFYAGDNEPDLTQLRKQTEFLHNCLSVKQVAELAGTYSLWRLWRGFKNNIQRTYYNWKKRQHPDAYGEALSLLSRHERPTKYAFVPSFRECAARVYLTESYRQPAEAVFEGVATFVPADAEAWVMDYYPEEENILAEDKPRDVGKFLSPETMRRIQLIELDMLIEFDRICRKHGLKYALFGGTLLGAVRHKGFIPWDDDVDVAMPYADMLRFIEVAKVELDPEKYFLRTQETDIDNNLTFIQIRRNHTQYRRPNRAKFRTHNGVFIDIAPMFPGSSSRILHYLQTKITRFYKSALWAHMYYDYGDESDWSFKRLYYRQLSRIPPKTAYAQFIKYATWFSGKNGNLSYLAHNRNPFAQGWTQPGAFDHPVELEFEGHLFFAPRDYVNWLEIGYGADYLRYPELQYRYPKHRAEYVMIGDLHAYEPAKPSVEENHANQS